MRDPAIRYTRQRHVFSIIGALMLAVLCSVSQSVVLPHASIAAPPAQDVDLCALLPAGGRISVNDSDACLKVYTEYPAPLDAQIRLFRPGNPVPANVAIHDLEAMVCKQGTTPRVNCAKNSLGDYGFSSQVQYFEFSEYWNRGCYNVHVRANKYDGESLVLPVAQSIDVRLKTMLPCLPAAAPGRLNVGIGGTYDEANDRVTVTAGVENRPNVGIGDDYYEWTLDGTLIQQGKELSSIEYDTTSLAEGEHEILVKVTDRVNNVSGGATFKFSVKRNKDNPPPNTSNGQLQSATPSGTQNVAPGNQVQVPQGGQADLSANCLDLKRVIPLLGIVWYDEIASEVQTYLKSGNIIVGPHMAILSLMVKSYKLNCGQLNLFSFTPHPSTLASPLGVLLPLLQSQPAQIALELQHGPGRFQIQNAGLLLAIKTSTTVITSNGKNDFGLLHDPDTNQTFLSCYSGSVSVQPTNSSLAPLTLQAGQSVIVTADKIGNVQQTQNAPSNSSVPGTTLSMPPFGSTEPYPAVNGRTIQIAQRHVPVGDSVLIPVWLMNANDVANINTEMTFDSNIARPEGTITKGYLLDNALFRANPKDSGIVRIAFAQPTNLANATGPMAYIPFRAVGNPGDRTTLMAQVTSLNNQDGGAQSIDRINGEIVILNKDGTLPGDSGTDSLPSGACSGKKQLTELDALCALEISVGLRPATQIMDMDDSGAIDSRDAVLILKRVIDGK